MIWVNVLFLLPDCYGWRPLIRLHVSFTTVDFVAWIDWWSSVFRKTEYELYMTWKWVYHLHLADARKHNTCRKSSNPPDHPGISRPLSEFWTKFIYITICVIKRRDECAVKQGHACTCTYVCCISTHIHAWRRIQIQYLGAIVLEPSGSNLPPVKLFKFNLNGNYNRGSGNCNE